MFISILLLIFVKMLVHLTIILTQLILLLVRLVTILAITVLFQIVKPPVLYVKPVFIEHQSTTHVFVLQATLMMGFNPLASLVLQLMLTASHVLIQLIQLNQLLFIKTFLTKQLGQLIF